MASPNTEFEGSFPIGTSVAEAAVALFGQRRSLAWMQTANRALGGARPADLLVTSDGAREVADVLGRIEHGVFS